MLFPVVNSKELVISSTSNTFLPGPRLDNTHLAKVRAGNVLEPPGPEIDAEARVPASNDEYAALDPPNLMGNPINDVHNFW